MTVQGFCSNSCVGSIHRFSPGAANTASGETVTSSTSPGSTRRPMPRRKAAIRAINSASASGNIFTAFSVTPKPLPAKPQCAREWPGLATGMRPLHNQPRMTTIDARASENLERFSRLVRADPRLHAQLRAAPSENDFVALTVRLGTAHGCNFSAATVVAALREQRRALRKGWL